MASASSLDYDALEGVSTMDLDAEFERKMEWVKMYEEEKKARDAEKRKPRINAVKRFYEARQALEDHRAREEGKKHAVWSSFLEATKLFDKVPEPDALSPSSKKHTNKNYFESKYHKHVKELREYDPTSKDKFPNARADIVDLWSALPADVIQAFSKKAKERLEEAKSPPRRVVRRRKKTTRTTVRSVAAKLADDTEEEDDKEDDDKEDDEEDDDEEDDEEEEDEEEED